MARGYPPMPPLPPKRARPFNQPLLVKHPPVINHSKRKWHHTVPYPYQFKWDGAWLLVAFLAAGGIVFPALKGLACFIAFVRIVVWLSYRFPLTTTFFMMFFVGMLGGRRRRW